MIMPNVNPKLDNGFPFDPSPDRLQDETKVKPQRPFASHGVTEDTLK